MWRSESTQRRSGPCKSVWGAAKALPRTTTEQGQRAAGTTLDVGSELRGHCVSQVSHIFRRQLLARGPAPASAFFETATSIIRSTRSPIRSPNFRTQPSRHSHWFILMTPCSRQRRLDCDDGPRRALRVEVLELPPRAHEGQRLRQGAMRVAVFWIEGWVWSGAPDRGSPLRRGRRRANGPRHRA